MNMTNEQRTVGYEYKKTTVARSMESAYVDGYSNFGWELEGTEPALQGEIAIILKFKRNRKMKNNPELARLEREFEKHIRKIEQIEHKKNASFTGSIIGAGMVGAGFLIGAVYSFIAGSTVLGIVLLVPSLAGWAFGFISARNSKKKAEQLAPEIDNRFDEVYDVCEKANDILISVS